jgi:hypothetical protein
MLLERDGALQLGEAQYVVHSERIQHGSIGASYNLSFPAEIDNPVPILVEQGFLAPRGVYSGLIDALVCQENRIVAEIYSDRTQKDFSSLHSNHLVHPERVSAQAFLGVTRDVIRKFGKEFDFDQVEGIGHSMGGLTVVNAASVADNYRLYKSVIPIASVGQNGHNLPIMAARSLVVAAKEVLPAILDPTVDKDISNVLNFLYHAYRNPWRTLRECRNSYNGDIRNKVIALGRLGVMTAALNFKKDHFFPIDEVSRHCKERFDIFEIFDDQEANHLWPVLRPRQVASAIARLSIDLERKKLAKAA